MIAALDEGWADPAKLYREGRRARTPLDAAREATAAALGAKPDETSFWPSGSAALRTGLAGLAAARQRVGRHLLTSAVEHSSVLGAASEHEAAGGTVTVVPVGRDGRVDAERSAAASRADTALATPQTGNHETGVAQPVAEAARAWRRCRRTPLCDAAQSAARVPLDGTADAAALAASARKWGGPPGVGAHAGPQAHPVRRPPPPDERNLPRSWARGLAGLAAARWRRKPRA